MKHEWSDTVDGEEMLFGLEEDGSAWFQYSEQNRRRAMGADFAVAVLGREVFRLLGAAAAERERCTVILEDAMEEIGGDATERTLAGEAAADSTGWLRFAQSEMAMGFYKTLRLLVEKIRQG